MDIVTGVGVLDKAALVLRAVAERPMSLTGLQAATGLPRATAHRLAVALEAHGMLRRDVDGRFDLGAELAALGRLAADRFPLAELALPVLRSLRDETGESVQLFEREGSGRRCVLSLQSPHALRWIVPEGVLFPLGLGSAGRVLTGETSRAGWVQSVEERESGVASVSAAVRDDEGMVVAAVSVSGPIDRLTRQPGKRFGAAVAAAAGEVSARLHGSDR
ncbi:MAG: IclR family transcriptional regulator C-terminal domain-containing protein [Ilumatobacter sp.]|uniref:IclR family transcriptional regulator n=1 Tax=Ilumatobacter sp. TaxID=1967498 RepID=UPI0026053DC8|nr:IclR family transcriptional regulator C-terminal domain-containing protein [Ilumatobacter sp.]MDJ0769313.1 IclR family transcriptional regulator C-terminal domain-containing protein [Ilumatobacter sp.]